MKIAIIGRGEILFKVMERIHEEGFEIPLVVTSKEAPEYTKTSSDFKMFAEKIGSNFIHNPKINVKDLKKFCNESNSFDLAVSINYTGIITQDVIDLFRLGILNMHAGDLPRYKGNAVVAWAIINYEKKIVNCIHKMEGSELDSGDIIVKETLNINVDTKISEIFNWLYSSAPNLFIESISKLKNDPNYIMIDKNNNNSKSMRCYPRMPIDGKIIWSKSSLDIHNLIRASSHPFQGAFTSFNGKKVAIFSSKMVETSETFLAIPGQILNFNSNDVEVATADGKLIVSEFNFEDKFLKPNEFIKTIRSRFV